MRPLQLAGDRLGELAFVAGSREGDSIDLELCRLLVGEGAHPVGERVRTPEAEEDLLGVYRDLRRIGRFVNQFAVDVVPDAVLFPDECVIVETLVGAARNVGEKFVAALCRYILLIWTFAVFFPRTSKSISSCGFLSAGPYR